jgi:hypothetical protein
VSFRHLLPSDDGTHHVREGHPAYGERFDEVLKFHTPGLAAVRRGGFAWHIDPTGAPAYERRFRRTFGFYDDLAAVEGDDGFHHVTPGGLDAYPERYAWCGNFQERLCTVRERDGRYRHIDPAGAPCTAASWRYAGDFRDGGAVVQRDDGLSTHIARDGSLVHGLWFEDLDVLHKGLARARDDRGFTHVDRRGRPAYARRFAMVEPFYNGQARVERFDGALEVIDAEGAALCELRPPRPELARAHHVCLGRHVTDEGGARPPTPAAPHGPGTSSIPLNSIGNVITLVAPSFGVGNLIRLNASATHVSTLAFFAVDFVTCASLTTPVGPTVAFTVTVATNCFDLPAPSE